MLKKHSLNGAPANTKLHFICSRCGGHHYFYGSAVPDNLEDCRLCMEDGDRSWINRIHSSKCHVLSTDQATRVRPLNVIRNNPGPYKRKANGF